MNKVPLVVILFKGGELRKRSRKEIMRNDEIDVIIEGTLRKSLGTDKAGGFSP